MSLDALNNDIKRLIDNLEQELPNEVLKLGNDAAAIIKNRVISTGETNKSAKNYKGGYYSNLRSSKGRQTGHKDYFFTGRLWNTVKAIPGTIKNGGLGFFSVEITSTDSQREKVIGYLNEQENVDILHLKPNEEEEIKGFMAARIDRIIKRFLA